MATLRRRTASQTEPRNRESRPFFKAPAAMSSKVRIRRDMTPPSLRLRLQQRRRPAPEIVVGQVRAAPPAVDRVVAGKVFLMGEDSLAEIGE